MTRAPTWVGIAFAWINTDRTAGGLLWFLEAVGA